jgi:hypothetical protein
MFTEFNENYATLRHGSNLYTDVHRSLIISDEGTLGSQALLLPSLFSKRDPSRGCYGNWQIRRSIIGTHIITHTEIQAD